MFPYLALPGLEPWIAAACLAFSGFLLRSEVGGVFFAPALLTTAVLLLATGRTWTNNRRVTESIGLGIGQFTGTLVLVTRLPHPFDFALLPLVALTLIVAINAACAWRFAADEGQAGSWWVLQWALPSTIGPAFGLFFTLPVVLCLVGQTVPLVIALLVAGATLLGRQLQIMLTPAPARRSHQARRDDEQVTPL
jgi:hypothetical protein